MIIWIKLEMNQNKLAQEFFTKYASMQATMHTVDLKKIKLITSKDQLAKSDIKETYT
jgi:hypothetical protein